MLRIYFNGNEHHVIQENIIKKKIKCICMQAIEEGVRRYNHNWFDEEGKDEKKSQDDVIEVADQEDKNKMVFNIPGQSLRWFDDYGLCHYISEAMNEYRFELLDDDKNRVLQDEAPILNNLRLMSPILYLRTIQHARFARTDYIAEGTFTWLTFDKNTETGPNPDYFFSFSWDSFESGDLLDLSVRTSKISFNFEKFDSNTVYFVDETENMEIKVNPLSEEKNGYVGEDFVVEVLEKASSHQKSLNIVLGDVREEVFNNYGTKIKGNHLHFVYHFKNANLMIRCIRSRDSWHKGGSFGGYDGRADSVNEVEYRWYGNIAFGIAMGLESQSLIQDQIKPYEEDELTEEDELQNIQSYATSENYFVTNYPRNRIYEKVEQGTNSEILYFKRLIEEEKRKNLPDHPAPPNIAFDKLDQIPFKNKGPNTLRHKETAPRKDAGTVMGDKLSHMLAGDEMKGKRLPATAFAKYTIGESDFLFPPNKEEDDSKNTPLVGPGSCKSDWHNYKNATWTQSDQFIPPDEQKTDNALNSVRTSQEWCHLYGHGDGGTEVPENFVSGSNHCNTEQLAIETGQRYNEPEGLKSIVTAYLFVVNLISSFEFFSETAKRIYPKSEIILEGDKIKFTYPNTYSQTITTKNLAFFVKDNKSYVILEPDFLQTIIQGNLQKGFELPLAKLIHYKITNTKDKMIFEHIFDAQSESLNQHECKILDYTVRRIIANEQPGNLYEKYKKNVDKKLRENLKKLDDCRDVLLQIIMQNAGYLDFGTFIVEKKLLESEELLRHTELVLNPFNYIQIKPEKKTPLYNYILHRIYTEDLGVMIDEGYDEKEEIIKEEYIDSILQRIVEYIPVMWDKNHFRPIPKYLYYIASQYNTGELE